MDAAAAETGWKMQKRKAAVVCCSDARHNDEKEKIFLSVRKLEQSGFDVIISDYIFAEKNAYCAADARERAAELMKFYTDKEITDIFDVSGGNIANSILPYLDYGVIAESNAVFWGYSDLTTVINAIYAQTGKSSVLYQVKNLAGAFSDIQTERFCGYVGGKNRDIFDFKYSFLRGESMEGVVIGGNIRCFLKLAGTPYMPDLNGKILFLEALNCTPAQVETFISQLCHLGAFNRINGILLGTFTKMEEKRSQPTAEEIILRMTEPDLPVAKTYETGHGQDSKAVMIGDFAAYVKRSVSRNRRTAGA